MKLNTYLLKSALLGIVFIYCCNIKGFSQDLKSDDWKQPGLFLGGGAGVAKTQIIDKIDQEIQLTQVNNGNYFVGSIEIGYFFSRYFGLTTGMSYSQYRSNLYIDSYQNQLNTVDIENDPYELRISGNDINELQQFDILSIPLCVNIRVPLGKTVGAYLQTGINFFVPISESYESVGTFTYQGYFPAYNILLENLPEYGFPSDLKIQSEGEPELNPLSFGFVMSLGIDYMLNKRVQLITATYFDRSLSEVLADSQTGDFYLTTNPENINSILGCANKVTIQSFGLKIGIRYYFTDYYKFKYYSHPSVKKNLRDYERERKSYFGK